VDEFEPGIGERDFVMGAGVLGAIALLAIIVEIIS